ncbi:50S ribosomal protein L23 [Myxococcota bacterium]|nr:50S ribosomal protein L23 [Myxococcota bacterium]MBU1430971.1 50S ribosomal protein L23 [Myxococcota bacterium]MBU1897234.1 50S ribosomal protein L23 [Myxococcota bacterium]
MKAKDIHSILRRPMVTEKTTLQKEDNNQVVFMVRRDANKIEIRAAVETLLSVRVEEVNTLNVRGKSRRVGRYSGKRSNWKKAIVTLAAGEEVEFFGALEALEGMEEEA